ncbi:MAG: hypothetical protein KC431_03165 [Myxococcales bacterium]|nr:hypothetical protein [Myxococcales bacterium]
MASRTALVMLALVSAACGELAAEESSSSGSSDDVDGSGSESGDSTDAPGETNGSTGEPPAQGSLVGWVDDIDGVPIPDLPIALCGQVCQIATTDAEGRFEVLEVAPGAKVLEPALVPVGDEGLAQAVISWTRFFDIVTLGEDEALVLPEPFVMQRVEGAVGPLTGLQQLEPAPGLLVGFDADAILAAGPLPAGAEGVWLGATEVPPPLWPSGGLGDWQILAAWRFAIWDLEDEDGFAVAATLPQALEPGAEVAFLVADYTYGFLEGTFHEEAAVLSPDGTTLSTPIDGGLDRSTMWLAVTR